jgi:hypothetical protein
MAGASRGEAMISPDERIDEHIEARIQRTFTPPSIIVDSVMGIKLFVVTYCQKRARDSSLCNICVDLIAGRPT